MQKVLVRYKLKADKVEENRTLVEAVYAQLAEQRPAGLRYTTLCSEDGRTWFHLASVETESNPLQSLSAFADFQAGIRQRCEEPPAPVELELVGAYGFFDR